MRQAGTKTKYPGVYKLSKPKQYRVRGKYIDPRTGKSKEVDRVLQDVIIHQAAKMRAELIQEARNRSESPKAKRLTVTDYAKLWIESKAIRISAATATNYCITLEKHILPKFGDVYYDVLAPSDVQGWVDNAIRSGYTLRTVKRWYKTFHTMSADAVRDLDLSKNPINRITFPEETKSKEPNVISDEQLEAFLNVVSEKYPGELAYILTALCSGMRFCHVSAIKWTDWDETAGIIHIMRKNVRGTVGRLSRNKRALERYPVDPQLAHILRWHRARLQATKALGEWMFPGPEGGLRSHSTTSRRWKRCLVAAGISSRFTIHGARYMFTDFSRRTGTDPITRRELVGHTAEMQSHYSTVNDEEKRVAISEVVGLIPLPSIIRSGDRRGDNLPTEIRR